MIKQIYKNNNGITLIEVLATITIASLVIGLLYSVLSSSLKFNEKTNTHIDLRQDANIIVTNIRNLHSNEENICYDNLLPNEKISMTINNLGDEPLLKGECRSFENDKILPVEFTLKDKEGVDSFTIDTIIDGKMFIDSDSGDKDDDNDETFYDYLKNNHVFIYGSHLGIYGSTPVEGSGTVVINNLNKSDLVFSGNNELNVEKIYIDKNGNDLIFRSSTKLGKKGQTKVVRIIGDVNLDNGDSQINADTVYIDGNVTFGNSAQIHAKKVIITGDVIFKNWSARIIADEVYINGTVKNSQSGHPGHIEGEIIKYSHLNEEDIPKPLASMQPKLHDAQWYTEHGYEVRTNGNLSNGSKIYSPGTFTVDNWQSNRSNVIIMSEGDIHIKNMGGSTLTGILFAPNGKVIFNGGAFKGIVIARNGFDTASNPSVSFINVKEFFNNPEEIPFK